MQPQEDHLRAGFREATVRMHRAGRDLLDLPRRVQLQPGQIGRISETEREILSEELKVEVARAREARETVRMLTALWLQEMTRATQAYLQQALRQA